MQINLFDQYFEKGLYSYDTFLVLAEKNDVRVSIVGIVFLITIFSSFLLLEDGFTWQQKLIIFRG